MSKKSSTVIVVGALLAAAAIGSSQSSSKTVSVWGDSLTVDAQSALRLHGASVHARGGTAPCDWLPGFEKTLVADHPSHVLLAFVGNIGTPCMAGVHSNAELAARYRTDYTKIIAIAVRHRVPVTLVVPPYMDPKRFFYLSYFGAPELTTMECGLAATLTDWVNCDTTARNNLAVDGHYSYRVNGRIARRVDGVHLTPYGGGLYASGILAARRPSGGRAAFREAK